MERTTADYMGMPGTVDETRWRMQSSLEDLGVHSRVIQCNSHG